MLTYILVTLTILIVILCFTVFYEYRQINQLTMTVQRNHADMAALRHILDNEYDAKRRATPPPNEPNFPFVNDDVIEEQGSDEDATDDTSNDDDDDDEAGEDEDEDKDDDKDNKEDGKNESEKEPAPETGGGDLEEIDAVLDQIEKESDPETKEVDVDVEVTLSDKVKKTTPNDPAKNFPDGHTMTSTNDSKQYVVTSTKAGVKRWKKVE